MSLIKNITGLFVGQNSKKRQMGIGMAFATVGLYYFDFIDAATMESFLGLVALWLGVAFSSKLTKLGDAVSGLKKK
tara:strand:- start:17 stop:244 length:228 start_codon:yes stop_codon:yes gene_type:complete